ncbi:helix-turn-helix domain-containing protein [Halalkalibacter krulwichiae]|uniref:HTH-type transcriptional regulator SinR n=1 Tax=Halalkalibacter krulwichiae TaxID=199441 RepID=A0A1X9MHG1_9BACI|nr:XRE family transcriptional regulator [Halalkalibacter krulwichiae]ARK31563.1 HTH-type transcriptional regulator SinR [Halalkalibacter krulwichiae]
MKSADSIAKQVGMTLRKIRQDRGISLQDLADKTDVSKLTLGNIERGEANPSLSIIWKIANGLSIPISTLLQENNQVTISRAHQGNKVVSANQVCVLEPMFEVANYGQSELHRAFLKPNSEYKPGAHQPGVIEYVTVMSGELIIQIENETYHLFAYDSLKFNADRIHAYINPTSSTTILHFVMTYLK